MSGSGNPEAILTMLVDTSQYLPSVEAADAKMRQLETATRGVETATKAAFQDSVRFFQVQAEQSANKFNSLSGVGSSKEALDARYAAEALARETAAAERYAAAINSVKVRDEEAAAASQRLALAEIEAASATEGAAWAQNKLAVSTDNNQSAIRSLAGSLGRGSEFTLWTKTLMGGGALMGVGLIMGQLTSMTKKFADEMGDAEKSASDIARDFIQAIPGIGHLEQMIENIATGIGRWIFGTASFNKELAESERRLGDIRQTAERNAATAQPTTELEKAKLKAQETLDKSMKDAQEAEAQRWQSEIKNPLADPLFQGSEYRKTVKALNEEYYAAVSEAEKKAKEEKDKGSADSREREQRARDEDAARQKKSDLEIEQERLRVQERIKQARERDAEKELAESEKAEAVRRKIQDGQIRDGEIRRQQAKSIHDENRTAAEKYADELKHLMALQESGDLSRTDYERAVKAAAAKAKGKWGGVEDVMGAFSRIGNAAATVDPSAETARNTADIAAMERAALNYHGKTSGHLERMEKSLDKLAAGGGATFGP